MADVEAGIGIHHRRAEFGVRIPLLWLVILRMRALHLLRRRCHQVQGVGVLVQEKSRGKKKMTTTMMMMMMMMGFLRMRR